MALSDIIARLAVELSMETAAFEKGATLAEKRMEQNRKKLESIGKKMSGIGKTMSVAITAPLAALGYASVKAAQESAEALGQVDAALKSMGDGAGRTSEQLKALADSQMRQSLYDDDEILRKVTANLLTFGSVAGEQFDRAQQAALDLSARLGQDLQQSTIMIGKALNDPILGLTAMRRVGIQFTEAQEEQIKKMVEFGDVAGAQAIMLGELERQFGGAAKAMRDADPMAAAKMDWAEFQETIGEKLLPILPVVAEAITKVLDAFASLSPEMQKAVVIGGVVVAALGPILTLFGGLITVGAPLISFLGALAPALSIVGKSLLLIALNPAVLALAVVLGGIYLAWKNWDKIEPILRRLYEGAKKWIMEGLGHVLDWVLNPIGKVQSAFKNLYTAVVGNSYIPDMVDGIAAHMARLDAVMVAPVAKATTKAEEAFKDLAANVQAILDRLFPEVRRKLDFKADMAALEKAGLSAEQLTEARIRLANEYSGGGIGAPNLGAIGPIGDLEGGLRKFEDFADRLTKKSKETTVRIAKSFKDMADETLSSLSRLTDAIRGGGFLNILEAVIGFGLQLGSIGAFGKTIATRLNSSVPAYAGGTNFHSGGLALVGERGPELVSMPRGSKVYPSGTGPAAGNTYYFNGNLMTPEFWARIQSGDMQAADAGAAGGMQRMRYANSRRVG